MRVARSDLPPRQVLQHDSGGVPPGCAHDPTAGMRARARKVDAASGPAVLRHPEERPHREHPGDTRNAYSLAGGRPLPFLLVLSAFLLTAIYPWVAAAASIHGGLFAFGLLVALRACAAVTFRHGWGSIALHPIGSVLVTWIAVRSFLGTRRGTLRWKDRHIMAVTGG
jgi:hypothetical protein